MGEGSGQASCSSPSQRQMMRAQAKAVVMGKMGDAQFYPRGRNLRGKMSSERMPGSFLYL